MFVYLNTTQRTAVISCLQMFLTCLKLLRVDLLLQFGPQVSLQLRRFFLVVHVHVGAALDLAVLVGGDTPVLTRVGFRHLPDLQFGLLALLLDGDPPAVRDLPPFTLHPLDVGDGVAAHLGDEGGRGLCGVTGRSSQQYSHLLSL